MSTWVSTGSFRPPPLRPVRPPFIPNPDDYYDPYFYHARPENLYTWSEGAFRNVRLADVTCDECSYKPQKGVLDPKRAYAQHQRLRHPERKYRKKQFIIPEDEFIVL